MIKTQKKLRGTVNFIFTACVILSTLPVIYFSFQWNYCRQYFKQDFVTGLVIEVLMEDVMHDPYVTGRKLGRQNLRVKLLEGEYQAREFTITNNITRGHNIYARPGSKYIFTVRNNANGPVVWLYNYNRANYLYLLTALFILLVVIIAGIKGIKSLIALYFTGVMVIFVLIPIIFRGYDPIPFSIIILSLIVIVSFIMIAGYSKKTIAAITGTIGGIIIAGLISYLSAKAARLSGIQMEKGEQILYLAQDFNIKIKGLLFISILIASLGAIMDVAMSVTSAMTEIKLHKPEISAQNLFKSGMNIGRDIISTMINTLILAFAGSSFTLLLMIFGFRMEYKQFINIPVISIEIIQAISGSIGILLTVPLTNIATIILLKKRSKDEVKTNF